MTRKVIPAAVLQTTAFPQPGDQLSYSAGTTDLSPDRYRVITSSSDRAAQILAALPVVSRFLGGGAAILVNNYPASLGRFRDVIQVDTFLRDANFSRGLLLAASSGRPAIVIGQPFAVAQLLHEHLSNPRVEPTARMPTRTLFVLGGYECPSSLEDWMASSASECQSEALVLHAYGAAEADFACMVGLRNRSSRAIEYRPVASTVTPQDVDGSLVLVGPSGRVATGDQASAMDGAWVIRTPESRYPAAASTMHESWGPSEWSRYTGYAMVSHQDDAKCIRQLRPRVQPREPDEVPFYRFWETHGGWLSEKPRYVSPKTPGLGT